jgi:hypothetical protein
MTKTFQDYANIGSAVLTGNAAYVKPMFGQALRARNDSNGLRMLAAYAVPTPENLNTRVDGNRTMVGYTTPALTFDKMRQINGSALSLNFDIEKNVARASFKEAWNRWFADWQHFFDRYQAWGAKLGALIDSDALATQVESYRVDLMGNPKATPKPNPGWVGNYSAELTAEGKPVPPTSAAPVDPELAPGEDPKTRPPEEGLPWWVVSLLVVGGVSVVAGTIFIIRRKVIEAETAKRMLERDVLPMVLGSAMGPTGVAFAHAAANSRDRPTSHDPSAFMGVPPHGTVYFVG